MSGAGDAPSAWRYTSPVSIDAVCLALITFVSALPYLRHLGFYSDDWGLLAGFSEPGTSLATVVRDFVERPVQGIYLFLLFKLFGLDPLGYHVVNTLVLAGSASLLFLILFRLGLGRAASFATTLIFVTLPQLSTVRVWYASFQIPLALLLALVSMHCQLSFARSRQARWAIAAIVSAILSLGAYEIFAPLIAGFAVMLAIAKRRSRSQSWALAAIIGATAVGGVVYKLALSGRAGQVSDANRYLAGIRQFFRLNYDWRVDSGLNIIATPSAYLWSPVRGWWAGAWLLVTGQAGVLITIIAVLVAVIAVWRLSSRESVEAPPKRLLLLGIAAFLLGNATFLIVPAVVFTSTGMGNRVQVAAAIGVAMMFAASLALVATVAGEGYRRAAFSVLVAVISAAALVRLTAIVRYWAEASALQQPVLAAAQVDLRKLPAQSKVILDGVCPYHGPAVVFEEAWDWGGALTLALGQTMYGDTVNPRMSVTAQGLATSIYKQPSVYPYGPGLYVYDPARHRLVQLGDVRSARDYFRNRPPSACRGYVARGIEV